MTLQATSAWTKASGDLQIPPGIDAIAWGVSMVGNGTLVTDDYSVVKADDGSPATKDPAVVGKWTVADYNMPIRAIHSTVLRTRQGPDGRRLGERPRQLPGGKLQGRDLGPGLGHLRELDSRSDMFCAGHVILPDGRVLIQGGTKSYPKKAGTTDYGGLRTSYIFDPEHEDVHQDERCLRGPLVPDPDRARQR